AGGTAPFAYQWYLDGNAIFRATNATFSIVNFQTNDAGTYLVVITNLAGSVTSAPIVLTFFQAVSIVSHSPDQVVPLNGTLNLQVTVSGDAPFTYQWSFNNNPIGGATNSTFTLSNMQLTNAGVYSVVVSNIAG